MFKKKKNVAQKVKWCLQKQAEVAHMKKYFISTKKC